MVVAGVLAARGNISLPGIIAVCATAAVLGDQVGYLIGRHYGPGLRRSRLGCRVGEARWAKAQDAVTRHGAWAVAGGRWVAVLRALVPTVAGAIAMPYRRFLLANAVGGSVWAAGAVLVGYFAGGSVSTAQDLLGRTSLIGLTLVSILAVVTVVKYLRRRGRVGQAGPAGKAGQTGQFESRPDSKGEGAGNGTGEPAASSVRCGPDSGTDRRATVGS